MTATDVTITHSSITIDELAERIEALQVTHNQILILVNDIKEQVAPMLESLSGSMVGKILGLGGQ